MSHSAPKLRSFLDVILDPMGVYLYSLIHFGRSLTMLNLKFRSQGTIGSRRAAIGAANGKKWPLIRSKRNHKCIE